MIFDTHAHYDDEDFDGELAARYPWMYAAIGVHPSDTGELSEDGIGWLREAAAGEKVVAIGEIGLDYYWEEPEHEVQKKWFSRQLALAGELKLPVVIHSRDAARDTLDMMKAECARENGGVIHCFSYAKEMAREYLNMGFYLGIGVVVTFKNAKKLKEVVEYAPLSPVPGSGAEPGKTQFVHEPALCGGGDRPDQGCEPGRGGGCDLGERLEALPDCFVNNWKNEKELPPA